MKRMIGRNVVFFLSAALFCFFTVSSVHAFRCGDEVIATGDSKARVLTRCGPPTLKEKIGPKKIRHTKREKSNTSGNTSVYVSDGPAGKSVEKWTYNCGEGDFLYVLTFERGVVASVNTDGKGKGRSDCQGR